MYYKLVLIPHDRVLILATLKATFLLAVLAIAIDMHLDHHFMTDLILSVSPPPPLRKLLTCVEFVLQVYYYYYYY